jgi:hypothetical protein
MSSRSMLFFMTGPEFCLWLREVLEKRPLSVIVDAGEALEPWRGEDGDILASKRIFLAPEHAVIAHRASEVVAPERAGWAVLDVPQQEDRTLFLCEAGAKSGWWDREHRMMRDDPAGVKIFDALRPSLRKRLSYPVWCPNVVSGAAAPYRTIGYSRGAAQLFAEGWALRQRGVANTRFEIRATSPSAA